MKKEGFLEKVSQFKKKNDAEVLTGLALVGLALTAVAAYKAAPKAEEILEEHRKSLSKVKRSDKKTRTEIKKDTAKKIAPVMAPAVIMGTATGACILGSHSASAKKIATLTMVYNLSEQTVKDMNKKMKEVLGEKKTKEIKDSIAKDHMDKQGVGKDENKVILTGYGEVLCKDLYTGREFRCNAGKIEQAVCKVSDMARKEMYITLNDFYSELNLEPVPSGENIGWIAEDTMDDGRLPIMYSALLTDSNEPCLAISVESLRPV